VLVPVALVRTVQVAVVGVVDVVAVGHGGVAAARAVVVGSAWVVCSLVVMIARS
jgi:hypothetical protein